MMEKMAKMLHEDGEHSPPWQPERATACEMLAIARARLYIVMCWFPPRYAPGNTHTPASGSPLVNMPLPEFLCTIDAERPAMPSRTDGARTGSGFRMAMPPARSIHGEALSAPALLQGQPDGALVRPSQRAGSMGSTLSYLHIKERK
jgi:hypothetical protein